MLVVGTGAKRDNGTKPAAPEGLVGLPTREWL